ncbi:hypothetical protein [Mycolicibacterium palauense]|uniref:hypothetical protein n=1 Tax=Mycolicibacterium palauense TaxID=2034511 RepID=UPI000BFF1679|nr:hypothetical protein [Mycolicibacterium palauense]
MTLPVELFDREAPPGVRFLVAWLAALPGGAGAERQATRDPLPFTELQRYDGHEDTVTDHGYYQLDHFAEAVDGKTAFTACEEYSRLCKRRILYLRSHSWTEVDVPDWGLATADLVRCIESPHQQPYRDKQIVRMVSRYYLDLRLVTV